MLKSFVVIYLAKYNSQALEKYKPCPDHEHTDTTWISGAEPAEVAWERRRVPGLFLYLKSSADGLSQQPLKQLAKHTQHQ